MTTNQNITFRKSSYSDQQGNCVEVGRDPHGRRLVRDSKDLSIAPQQYSATAWMAFLNHIKNGALG